MAIEPAIVVAIAFALALILLWPQQGLLALQEQARQRAQRTLVEDALKHIHAFQERNIAPTVESLAGAVGLGKRQAVALVARMERQGLVQSSHGGLQLSPSGEAWARQLVRAHRLWERYLADEVLSPLGELHGLAEREEHRLTPAQIDAIEARLGYPRYDPHGAPIPTREHWRSGVACH